MIKSLNKKKEVVFGILFAANVVCGPLLAETEQERRDQIKQQDKETLQREQDERERQAKYDQRKREQAEQDRRMQRQREDDAKWQRDHSRI